MTARRLIAVSAALLGALLFGPASARAEVTPEPPLSDADYFAFADHVTAAMERSWSQTRLIYRTGARSIDTIANAAMLTVFATAAASGHVGPARNDERARLLAKALTASPPFWTDPVPPWPDKMFHAPGWTSNMEGPYVDMDKSIDPKVAEGLQIAYRARRALGLDDATAELIADQIHRVAFTDFFRYPKVRLNQINWPAELYAYDWLVNGDPTLYRFDYRAQMRRFVRGFKKPWTRDGATNVGPSYRFIYQNNAPADLSRNLDSAEYANMTLHFLYWYDSALEAGMEPLDPETMRLLRAWVQRDLYGYWTHAGFMNWDTGWSYERWMKGKAWAYAQQGLLAIATSPMFQMRSDEGRWAKYLFDRGLRLYERLGRQRAGRTWRPSAQLFGIGQQGGPATKMFWARMAANAARAVSARLGDMEAKRPPPFYAFDPDIGRLAVSTPHYSTAILAVNRSKLPYGGLDLARLYDADGDPVAGTGGRLPASFGVLVSAPGNRRVVASQTGLHGDPKRPPLILTRSPRGRVARVRVLPTRPDAGPFRVLSVEGRRKGGGARVVTRYSFRSRSIEGRWTVRRRSGRGAQRVRVLFPTWGRDAVKIEAVMRFGAPVELRTDSPPLNLADVAAFRLSGERGGYLVKLLGRPRGSTQVMAVGYQRANPRGGPTLTVELPRIRRGRRELRVRLVPSASGGTLPEPAAADHAGPGVGESLTG